MAEVERVSRESFNLVQERYQKLKELFSEVFTRWSYQVLPKEGMEIDGSSWGGSQYLVTAKP